MSLDLQQRVEKSFATPVAELDRPEAESVFSEVLAGLNSGQIRAAVPVDGDWQVQSWVKQGILLGFRLGKIADFSQGSFPFFDKDTYPPKPMEAGAGVRIVPGGSSIRTGAFVAPGVVCMPPMYINVGAYVDENTMVDSHALVGSCAQVGKRVHLSAAAQIGGVLEPVGARPVIIEDAVFVGGNCGIYEGCLVRRRAVLAPGVILTGGTKLYDAVNGREITRQDSSPLEVPEGAVVVPGTRPLTSEYGKDLGLSVYAPIIVKYRDEKTDASTTLESALR